MHTARFNPWNSLRNGHHAHNVQHTKNLEPAVELYGNDDGYALKVDLPGVSKEDIAINVNDGFLVLEGERKRPDTAGKAFCRSEVTYGSFRRAFKLGNGVKANDITAEFANGVLTIAIPKPEEVKPKQIQIN